MACKYCFASLSASETDLHDRFACIEQMRKPCTVFEPNKMKLKDKNNMTHNLEQTIQQQIISKERDLTRKEGLELLKNDLSECLDA